MRRAFIAVSVVAFAVAGSACATKKYVRTRVDEVNTKVEGLSTAVEETEQRTRKNDARIGEVDQKADAAGRSAQEARGAADAAGGRAAAAHAKVDELGRASKRLIYEVVLSEDQGNFRFNRTALPGEARTRIDELIAQLKADPKGMFIEIEGHTDWVGPATVNQRIGLERAEAVKRYLYEHHQVPLHKMNVISYGEEKPVAPNRTREGRAQNRRVVIKVLA